MRARVVAEAHFARIARTRGEHTVGDGVRDDHDVDADAAEAADVY